MSDPPEFVDEYGEVLLTPDRVSGRDRATLASLRGDLVRCIPAAGGWRLRFNGVCGVLQLDRVRIVVRSRLIDGARVLPWLGWAAGLPDWSGPSRGWATGDEGLRDVVVAALLEECALLLRHGLRRDYRRVAAEDTVLRGRLDVRAQVARRYGQVDRLHLDRFDRRLDVWENVVCRAALDLAGHTAGTTALRRQARALAEKFPDCGLARPAVRRRLDTATYHRNNQHYRDAHGWARLLLGAGGLDDLLVHGSWQAGSLLIDMHRLWERIVVRLCDELGASPVTIAPPINVREDPLSARTFPPDALLTRPVGHLPVDAKYKNYRASIVDRSDAHQLLTYAAAFRTALDADPVALLVYPYAGQAARPRTVRVTGPAGTVGVIAVAGVNTDHGPVEAADVLLKACVALGSSVS